MSHGGWEDLRVVAVMVAMGAFDSPSIVAFFFLLRYFNHIRLSLCYTGVNAEPGVKIGLEYGKNICKR